ncbi:hypothetical protein GQ600_4969 [Phytophthora cactorum]|nr:hypothetical protein GQ600_4969 [Phytophthora cactorum]
MEGDNIIDMIKQQTHTGWDMAPRYHARESPQSLRNLPTSHQFSRSHASQLDLLLFAAAFLACVDSASEDSATTTITHSVTAFLVPKASFLLILRTEDAAVEVGEERGGVIDALKAGTTKLLDSAKLNAFCQLNAWLDNGKSVDDVFKLLKLGDDGYSSARKSKLTVLDDYIVKFNHLDEGFWWGGCLGADFTAAKHDMRTVTKAKQLEKGLLRQWRHENLEPASVMKLLKLDDDSRNLWTFEKYIAEFNKKNPENQVTLLGALTSKYEEGDVARAIVSGLKNENTAVERVAARLQKEQLEGWLKRDRRWFCRISRNLETLEAYILLYNRAKQVDETLVGALAKGFGGESQLAEMLMGARSFPYFNGKAKTLQNAQFKEWRDKGLNPTNVLSEIFVVAAGRPLHYPEKCGKEFTTFIQTNKPAVMRFTVPRRS